MANTGAKKRKGGGKRKPITQELYGKILEAFREHPENFNRVAKEAGITWRTAKKAWQEGWPNKPGMIAVREVLRREQELARARIGGEDEVTGADRIVERHRAHQNAVESREEEGRMVRACRAASMQTASSLLRLNKGVQALADRLNVELQSIAARDKLNVGQALGVIQRNARALRDLNRASHHVMEMERLHLGEPTQILGFTAEDVDELSVEEAAEEVTRTARALERARAQGLEVINGGAGVEGSEEPAAFEAGASNGTNGASKTGH